jgi:hypothetical protein
VSFNLSDYEPVASRIQRFYDAFPTGAIHCEIVHDDGQRVVVKTTVWRDINDTRPAAIDFAEELISDRGVNSTSRVENCCTSSTGRAISIAAHGLGPSDYTKKPSREEMAKVERQTLSRGDVSSAASRGYLPRSSTAFPDSKPSAMAEANGVKVRGTQHGPLPDWLVLEAFQAGVTEVYDNRADVLDNPKRPWFKATTGGKDAKAFWAPKGTPLPVIATHEDDLSEPGEEEPF